MVSGGCAVHLTIKYRACLTGVIPAKAGRCLGRRQTRGDGVTKSAIFNKRFNKRGVLILNLTFSR
jgi:hypothetical protein